MLRNNWTGLRRSNAAGGSTIAFGRLLFVLALLLITGCAPRRAHAQFIGYTSPQTVQQKFGTSVLCTGSPQTFVVNNLGQISHMVVINNIGPTITQLSMQMLGSPDGVITTQISDTYNGIGSGGLYATAYFPVVQVQVTCSPVNASSFFSLLYTGTGGTLNNPGGTFQQVSDKVVFNGITAGSNNTPATLNTPFGNMSGIVSFSATGALPANSFLQAFCAPADGIQSQVGNFPVGGLTSGQFVVPSVPCSGYFLGYVSGGASAQTLKAGYSFTPPGTPATPGTFTHVVGTTATSAKGTGGFLHTLNVNTAAAGTISIFDLATASCTGTPATNTVAVITVPAATNGLPPFLYDVNLLNGICVKASVAMDFTVSTQ
jgi:hypothetical protein